jgi:glycosyltransferase involved in cell wall biosynthesis
MKPVRVITSHPIQYQAPLYRYLAGRGLPLEVYFLSDRGAEPYLDRDFGRTVHWDIPLTEGYHHAYPRNLRRGDHADAFFGYVNPEVLSIADPRHASALWVHGYRNASTLGAIAAARLRGVPVLYRSETHTLNRTASPGSAERLRNRIFLRAVDAALSIGTANDEFYGGLGMPPETRFLVPYAVDNDRLQQVTTELSCDHARARLDLPSTARVVLFAGKLVEWKAPQLLLEAFAEVAKADHDVTLVYVGTGALEQQLRTMADRLAPRRVRFLGFLNQTEIPLAYAAADVLVLPSHEEPWGLVVNEAMNFALPVVVSDSVGCWPDLVDSQTGGVFRTSDVRSLEACLKSVLESSAVLRSRGAAALDRINRWSYAECHSGIMAALEACA